MKFPVCSLLCFQCKSHLQEFVKDKMYIPCNLTGKSGMSKVEDLPVSVVHPALCVWCVTLPLKAASRETLPACPRTPATSYGRRVWAPSVFETLTCCASLTFFYRPSFYMLSLTCCDWSWKLKSGGNLHLVNHRILEIHPWHIWRDLHYLVPLPLPTVCKAGSHVSSSLSYLLLITPCLILFSDCSTGVTLFSVQTINHPWTGPGSDISFAGCWQH